MKKVNFRLLSLIGLLAVAVFGILNPELATTVLAAVGLTGAGISGMTLATIFTGPATVQNANTLDPEHLRRFVSQQITMRKPDYYALDTIMRKIRKAEPTINPKVEFDEVVYRPFADTVASGFTQGGTATSGTLTVANVGMWAVDDIIQFRGVTGGDNNDFTAQITAINAGTSTLTITGVNGALSGQTVTQQLITVPNGTKAYRIGNAKNELDAQTEVKYTLPLTSFNYCQIHMAQLEQSKRDSKTRAESGYNFANKRDQVIYDYRSRLEAANLFGIRKIITGTGGKQVYLAGGLYHYVNNMLEFGSGGGQTNISIADVAALAETVFTRNAGSKEKILFAGSKVITGLNLIDKYDRHIAYNGSELYHGVNVTKLTSSFGTIRVVYSPTMDEHGKSDEALVLDMEYILKHEMNPLEVTPLDLNKAGVRNVLNALRWEEDSCLTLRYAGAQGVHVVWKPKLTT